MVSFLGPNMEGRKLKRKEKDCSLMDFLLFEEKDLRKFFCVWKGKSLEIPQTPGDVKELEKIERALKEIGEEDKIKVKISPSYFFLWFENEIYVSPEIPERILKRKDLCLEDLRECVSWLLSKWRSFLEEARKRGWIREENGIEFFVWENYALVHLSEDLSVKERKQRRELKRILEALKEVKKQGAESFLEICAGREKRIFWAANKLEISADLCSKVLKRKTAPGSPLSLEEALAMLKHLLPF